MLGNLLDKVRKRRASSDAPLDDDDPPFPHQQMFVLALCRICEPIAFMSIFPYIYYMVQSFNITSDDRQIAIYAGMVTSAFAFAEFSSGFAWGRASDKVGRKPILLSGLAGTGLSMVVFGFAQNIQTALAARALGGLLNGNIGVLQTTVAEVVKNKKHQPRAYAVMPFVWCLGSVIGAGLGGCLADPVKNYPSFFSTGTIWERFPYLLPNLICGLVVILGLAIGILFLEETHEVKKQRRDVGQELGRWMIERISARFHRHASLHAYSKIVEASPSKTVALVSAGRPERTSMHKALLHPSASTRSSRSLDSADEVCINAEDEISSEKPQHSLGRTFNQQVCLNILAYGILAFHTITFEQLMPVMLSMDDTPHAVALPFQFVGGFGLPSSTIGVIFSLQGVYQMVAQMGLYPMIHRRLGSLRTFRLCALSYPLLYFAVPYLVLLPSRLRMAGLVLILVWKVTAQALAYPSNMLLLTNSTPSPLTLGAVNGVAASSASLARAFGPTISGLIESYGLKLGFLGLPWWAGGLVAALGALESLSMRSPRGNIQDWQRSERRTSGRDSRASVDTDAGQSTASDDTLVEQAAEERPMELPRIKA